MDAVRFLDKNNQKAPYSINCPLENGKVKDFLVDHKKGTPMIYNDIIMVKNGIEIK